MAMAIPSHMLFSYCTDKKIFFIFAEKAQKEFLSAKKNRKRDQVMEFFS